MKVYLDNDSYPELREVKPGWTRHVVWLRAFRSALTDKKMWVFLAVLAIAGPACFVLLFYLIWLPVVYPWSPASRLQESATLALLLTFFAVEGFLSLTWGGNLMRPHLRRSNPICRESCPNCGYRLTSQLAATVDKPVQCPECGLWWDRSAFIRPFAITPALPDPHSPTPPI